MHVTEYINDQKKASRQANNKLTKIYLLKDRDSSMMTVKRTMMTMMTETMVMTTMMKTMTI